MNQVAQLVKIVRSNQFVILDTETTGLERGEVVQIGVIDSNGQPLIDTLIKPFDLIPRSATAIHGITDEMVASAPTFAEILPKLKPILTGTNVIVYNAVYDRKMLHQSAEACNIERTDWKLLSPWWCAMEAFAEIYGDWNSYRNSYRWQKLITAAHYYKLPVVDAHSALGDCQMTLAVCRKMAEGV